MTALVAAKEKPYTYNMSVFYRILLPIMGIILFIAFVAVLFKSPREVSSRLNVNVNVK
jgi:hypothetical protein